MWLHDFKRPNRAIKLPNLRVIVAYGIKYASIYYVLCIYSKFCKWRTDVSEHVMFIIPNDARA